MGICVTKHVVTFTYKKARRQYSVCGVRDNLAACVYLQSRNEIILLMFIQCPEVMILTAKGCQLLVCSF